MSDLIPLHQNLVGSDTIQTVNARELYEFLGIKSEYAHWFSRRVSTYGFVQGIDYTDAISGDGPIKTIEHHVSINMAKELSMLERTKKGKEARLYFLACEKLAISSMSQLPSFYNPSTKALVEALLRVDALEAREHVTQLRLASMESQQEITETKADMALDEAHRMTLEEFVVKNGLLRQFPESQLTHFCQQYGLSTPKVSVPGKSWDTEKSYPLQALAALQRYELCKPAQVSFVRKGETI